MDDRGFIGVLATQDGPIIRWRQNLRRRHAPR